MGCFEQNSPSSVLSPWLIDLDLPDPAVFEGIYINKELASSSLQASSSKRTASPTSNASSSPKDGILRKVTKRNRKSRAKPKVPVTQLSAANKLNFKDIVHQFTGNHNSLLPSPNFSCKSASPANCNMPPSAVNASATSQVLLARLAQSLKILDTLCAHFLPHGSAAKMQNQMLHNNCNSSPFFQGLISEAQAPTSIASEGQGRDSLKMASPNVSSPESPNPYQGPRAFERGDSCA